MLGVEFNKIHIRESLLCWTQNIDTAGCTGSSPGSGADAPWILNSICFCLCCIIFFFFLCMNHEFKHVHLGDILVADESLKTHRQKLQSSNIIPLRLQKFVQDADSQPQLFLQVLSALSSVLTPALLCHCGWNKQKQKKFWKNLFPFCRSKLSHHSTGCMRS